MGRRQLEPGGRPLLAASRVSRDTMDRIDAARGDSSRAQWVHRAILAALGDPPHAGQELGNGD